MSRPLTIVAKFNAFIDGTITYRDAMKTLRAECAALTDTQRISVDKSIVSYIAAKYALPVVESTSERAKYSKMTIGGNPKEDKNVNAARSCLSYMRSILAGTEKTRTTSTRAAAEAAPADLTVKGAQSFLAAQLKGGNAEARAAVKALMLLIL